MKHNLEAQSQTHAAAESPGGADLVLMGAPRLVFPGAAARPLNGKVAALLALAVLEPTATRRRVALLLWPDSPEPLARNNLRTLIHRLGKQLGVGLFGTGESIALNNTALAAHPVQADLIVQALRSGGASACELLCGVDLSGLEELQAWLGVARERFARRLLDELDAATSQALACNEPARAADYARASVALQPMSERAHRQLMHTLVASGDRAAALAAYEACKATLLDNLGALPDERTRGLHVRILQSQRGTDMPLTLPSPLVEREAPLAALAAAYSACRHVALEGEAGVGKTRLLRHFGESRSLECVTLRVGNRHEPYAALAQLLQEVQQRHALRLGRSEQLELARLAPAAFPGVAASSSTLSIPRLRTALRVWASRLFDRGVLMLALDDLHCADAASQALLAELIAEPTDGAGTLRFLLSHRTGELEPDLAAAIAASHAGKGLSVVTVQRLSLAGIEALLLARGQRAATLRQEAEQLFQATAGNPLFVVELALHGDDGEREHAAPGAVVGGLHALLQARLAGCSTTARHLAYVAGVAAADFSVELAAAVTSTSPLALMPAWHELQSRGLFAEHGLAHDLVRDAALASVPKAIQTALHRQVALHLESTGSVGQQVLQHWLVAGDLERALPHAQDGVRRAFTCGLSNAAEQERLLEVVGGLQGEALLQGLWDVSDMSLWEFSPPALAIHAALLARTALIARTPETKAWVQTEQARREFYLDNQASAAYERLNTNQSVDLPIEWLTRVELLLTLISSRVTGGTPARHSERCARAAAQVPDAPKFTQLRRDAKIVASRYPAHAGQFMRQAASNVRAARRAGDRGLEGDEQLGIAHFLGSACAAAAVLRRYRAAAACLGSERSAQGWMAQMAAIVGPWALLSGQFSDAIRWCESFVGSTTPLALICHPVLAKAWLDLGRPDLARCHADADVGESLLLFPSLLRLQALARSSLAALAGQDPVAPLEHAAQQLRERRAGPLPLFLLEMELARLHSSPQERIALGTEGLAMQERSEIALGPMRYGLLMLAEAHAEAGSEQCRAIALRGAECAARGRFATSEYPPDTLLRFAALLQTTDPVMAARLTYLAERWVRNALPHVPETARHAFVAEHPVNRRLLGMNTTAG